MILYYLTGTLLLLWIHVLWSRRAFYKLIWKISGPLGYPIVGMAHRLMRREDILSAFKEEEQKFGQTFFSWLGPYPFLVVGDPQIAQDILTSPHCVNKSFIYSALDDGAGRGLFSLPNPKWNLHRRLLNPAFGHKVLLNLMPIFNQEVNKLIKTFEMFLTEEVNLTKVFQNFTLKIAAQTTMGDKIPSDDINNFSEGLLSCYKCVQDSMTQMCFSPWLNFKAFNYFWKNRDSYKEAKSKIRTYIRNLIKQKTMYEPELSENKRALDQNIFIHRALNLAQKGHFDWQNVEDECNVIVFGAFETTSNTLMYILMLLAMFPQYQDKVFDEVCSIYSSKDDNEITYSDTQLMIYLDMVINETMRVMAPVPLVARQTEQEVRLSNDVVIPKGLQVAIDIFNMHRRTDIWGHEAHIFNPDNFLPSNLDGKHPYAFIPFTKGIRNCIGWRYALLSMKVTIARLILNYRFSTTFEYQNLHFVEDITIKLKETPLLRIYERNKNILKYEK
ncbi:probable cytochrome P450 313a4 isoform X1 [Bactrocera tryoni]|uniref:probable cytochrome P450 313a4 isoform X1 n=1 Tax=Bactrocera tryoni TaxID=59916 RepID=UPI001A96F217|nr:probable cytochrome P450 313a4 isoform X1 [Bactrocera tryoni]